MQLLEDDLALALDVVVVEGAGGPLVPVVPADLEAGVAVTMTTTVKTWVNMRAGPDNAEPVVVVVSPGVVVVVAVPAVSAGGASFGASPGSTLSTSTRALPAPM